MHPTKIIETRNWRQANEEHLGEFLQGQPGEDEVKLLCMAATLVAHDLKDRAYKEKSGPLRWRTPAEELPC